MSKKKDVSLNGDWKTAYPMHMCRPVPKEFFEIAYGRTIPPDKDMQFQSLADATLEATGALMCDEMQEFYRYLVSLICTEPEYYAAVLLASTLEAKRYIFQNPRACRGECNEKYMQTLNNFFGLWDYEKATAYLVYDVIRQKFNSAAM